MNTQLPPRWARAVLRRCLPPGDLAASVIGDLHEEWSRLEPGLRRWLWYVSTSVGIGIGFLVVRTRRAIRRGMTSLRRSTGPRFSLSGDAIMEWRQSARALLRQPVYSGSAIVTFALGIGLSTAIFSIVWGGLFQPLPFPDADRLVRIGDRHPSNGLTSYSSMSIPNFTDLRASAHLFDGLESFAYARFNVSADEGPERALGLRVSPGFFGVLGARIRMGRDFRADDPDGSAVILTWDLWRTRFGGDPSIVGRSITVDRVPREVIGVLEPAFGMASDPLLFVTFDRTQDAAVLRRRRMIDGIGRLREGVTLEQGRAELESIYAGLVDAYPEANEDWTAAVGSFEEWMVGRSSRLLALFAGATLLVLLIACVNVANLGIARAQDRRHEFAVRTALGAGRRRIVGHFLAESVMLALAGGAIGILVAVWATRLLLLLYGRVLPRSGEIGLDAMTLGFAFALAIVSGIAVGIVPAVQAGTDRLAAGLRAGGRGGESRQRIRESLVVAEIALAVMLTAGAGLLINTVLRLARIDLGVVERGAIVFSIGLPDASYPTPAAITGFFDRLIERTAALPGVTAVGATTRRPLTGGTNGNLAPADVPDAVPSLVELREVTPDLFDALGMRVVGGRAFTSTDTRAPGDAAVVNQALADAMFAGNAIGRRIAFPDDPRSWEIVGVVRNVAEFGPQNPARPTIYWPYGNGAFSATQPFSVLDVVVRTTGDPTRAVPAVRSVVGSLDPDLPIYNLARLSDLAARSIGEQRRAATSLLSVLAALALVLGAVGVYGLMAYAVSRRTRELGVRLALGATPGRLVRLILAQGMRLAVIGIAVGILLAIAGTRLIANMLAGVSPTDPLTFAAVALSISLVTVSACALPAWRAALVRGSDSLRAD